MSLHTIWDQINYRTYLRNFNQQELLEVCYPDIKEGLQLSPIRYENNPSFYVHFYPNGDTSFKDFATGPIGGFWKFVQLKESINFDDALLWVYLKLIGSGVTSLPKRKESVLKGLKFTLGVVRTAWNKKNLAYWEKYGISESTLTKYKVDPISAIYFYPGTERETCVVVNSNESYVYKEIKDNEVYLKTYCPLGKKEDKWFAVADAKSGVWHGWTQMRQTGELLTIDTSLKDVMVAKELFPEYDSVSMYSETLVPKPQIIEELKSRFEKIVIVGDNDFNKVNNPGKLNAERLSKLFDCPYILIPKEYNCKDRADLMLNLGKEKSIEIFKTLIL